MKKNVVITGATGGIGRAIRRLLAEHPEYEVHEFGRGNADFRNGITLEKEAAALSAKCGHVDVLIQGAGVGIFKPVEAFSLEEWNNVLDVNLTAPFLLMKVFLPGMKERNYGHVVHIVSDAAGKSFANAGAYCASKAGLVALSDCVRKEVQGTNIKITDILPGRVDTPFNGKQVGDRPDSLSADDVAAAVMFTLSQSERSEIERIYLNSVKEKNLH